MTICCLTCETAQPCLFCTPAILKRFGKLIHWGARTCSSMTLITSCGILQSGETGFLMTSDDPSCLPQVGTCCQKRDVKAKSLAHRHPTRWRRAWHSQFSLRPGMMDCDGFTAKHGHQCRFKCQTMLRPSSGVPFNCHSQLRHSYSGHWLVGNHS